MMSTEDLRFFDAAPAPLLPDGHARRGISVVAALSEWLVHTNRRAEGSWTQRYEHGVPVGRLRPVAALPPCPGTTVHFKPSDEIAAAPLDAGALRMLATGFAQLATTVETAPVTILHIARMADWSEALRTGSYRVSTRGAAFDEVGFVHASLPDQVAQVARLVYGDEDAELCVLVMDESTIRASGVEVRMEDGGDGTPYPHVYGAIDTAWVTDVRGAWFDDDGEFRY